MKLNKKAFTLVEIMIVVAIIALLAGIAIPNLLRAKVEGNETAARATLKSISTAMETYYATNNQYPLLTTALIGITPPYLMVDYFDGVAHEGYVFAAILTDFTYSVTAIPFNASSGVNSFTIDTQGQLIQN